MTGFEGGQEGRSQPTWTIRFEGDDGSKADAEAPPSRFVEVQVTYRLEVTDLAALQAAVEVLDGPPHDDVARRLRQVPANLVGWLLECPPTARLAGRCRTCPLAVRRRRRAGGVVMNPCLPPR